MGTFAVQVTAVGNHGCGREVKDGGDLQPCGHASCVDCITREFVGKLKSAGASFGSPGIGYGNEQDVPRALIRHWPGTPAEVTDDLLTGKRKGQF